MEDWSVVRVMEKFPQTRQFFSLTFKDIAKIIDVRKGKKGCTLPVFNSTTLALMALCSRTWLILEKEEINERIRSIFPMFAIENRMKVKVNEVHNALLDNELFDIFYVDSQPRFAVKGFLVPKLKESVFNTVTGVLFTADDKRRKKNNMQIVSQLSGKDDSPRPIESRRGSRRTSPVKIQTKERTKGKTAAKPANVLDESHLLEYVDLRERNVRRTVKNRKRKAEATVSSMEAVGPSAQFAMSSGLLSPQIINPVPPILPIDDNELVPNMTVRMAEQRRYYDSLSMSSATSSGASSSANVPVFIQQLNRNHMDDLSSKESQECSGQDSILASPVVTIENLEDDSCNIETAVVLKRDEGVSKNVKPPTSGSLSSSSSHCEVLIHKKSGVMVSPRAEEFAIYKHAIESKPIVVLTDIMKRSLDEIYRDTQTQSQQFSTSIVGASGYLNESSNEISTALPKKLVLKPVISPTQVSPYVQAQPVIPVSIVNLTQPGHSVIPVRGHESKIQQGGIVDYQSCAGSTFKTSLSPSKQSSSLTKEKCPKIVPVKLHVTESRGKSPRKRPSNQSISSPSGSQKTGEVNNASAHGLDNDEKAQQAIASVIADVLGTGGKKKILLTSVQKSVTGISIENTQTIESTGSGSNAPSPQKTRSSLQSTSVSHPLQRGGSMTNVVTREMVPQITMESVPQVTKIAVLQITRETEQEAQINEITSSTDNYTKDLRGADDTSGVIGNKNACTTELPKLRTKDTISARENVDISKTDGSNSGIIETIDLCDDDDDDEDDDDIQIVGMTPSTSSLESRLTVQRIGDVVFENIAIVRNVDYESDSDGVEMID